MNSKQRTIHALAWPVLTIGLLGLIAVAWILRTPTLSAPGSLAPTPLEGQAGEQRP